MVADPNLLDSLASHCRQLRYISLNLSTPCLTGNSILEFSEDAHLWCIFAFPVIICLEYQLKL
ncbi:hypothetical protein BDW62DRAFT_191883 [Aspergillus aurantiobrunneus]